MATAAALVAAACVSTGVAAQSGAASTSTDAARPAELPAIGKWSIGADGLPAHWLGQLYRGKALREPINVILVDEAGGTADQAMQRVVAAATLAGYPIRIGHSVGYQAYVGGVRYAQLPSGKDNAFSNEPFEINNNHGRIFGPHRVGQSWIFTAAFSREAVDPLTRPMHRYDSFNAARDNFTQRMDQFTTFKIVRFVGLDNALVGDPGTTTGDHDGTAVMLVARPR